MTACISMNFFRQNLILNLKNIPGWRTWKKIVVIECDDWGGIRMPSWDVLQKLRNEGLKVENNRYNNSDTLENRKDLNDLFYILNSVKDLHNHSAVMTPVTNVANPDFERIKASGFREYFFERFTDTLDRYYPGEKVFDLWKQGSEAGIFVPELHGREHISVLQWLAKLREGDKNLRTAFDKGFVFLKSLGVPEPASEFRAEFFFSSDEQKPFLISAIKEGIDLFREIFGFLPKVFVPGNNLFHPDFDKVVAEAGVMNMYVSHSMPYPAERGQLKYRRFIPGQKGPGGLTYYTRNCAFEPTDNTYRGIDLTMKQIAAAFRWGKPANISTHRVNFVGGINPANREKGLSELRKLLKAIVTKWPDVEFMSSGDALEYMRSTN